VRLVDFLGTEPGSVAAAFGSMAVTGPMMTVANASLLFEWGAGALLAQANAASPRGNKGKEGGGGEEEAEGQATPNKMAVGPATGAAAAAAASSAPDGNSSSSVAGGSGNATMPSAATSYREYLLSTLQRNETATTDAAAVGNLENHTAGGRRLLGILYDKTPFAVYGALVDSEPIVKPRSTHRVNTLLSDADRKAQLAMLRDEEAPFACWWSDLKSELRSSKSNSMLVLGR